MVLTRDAQEFVKSLPFRTLTRRPVVTSLYDEDETGVTHIRFADNADLMLVAPATANTIAKLANGFADDALGCVALALNPGVPVLVAPAMNGKMWQHPATQTNVQMLRRRESSLSGRTRESCRADTRALADFGRWRGLRTGPWNSCAESR